MSQISPEFNINTSDNSFNSQSRSLVSSQLSNITQEFESSQVTPKQRGWVNEHFKTVNVGGRSSKVCLADGCDKSFASGISTNTYKDHWRKDHSDSPVLRKTRFMFHDQLHINRLVKLVLSQHLDYRLVDQPEFKQYNEAMNPNKSSICRQTLAELIKRSKIHLTNQVCEKLANADSVGLTFDIWSAHKGARGFGCVTAHYVDTHGTMQNIIIYFKSFLFPHNAQRIKEFIERAIDIFDLRGRVVAITTDNASNNIAAIKMMDKSIELTSVNFGLIHYKCVAHIFDLGVKSAMKELKDIVRPVRDAVMAVRCSRKRKEAFNNKQKDLIDTGEQLTKQPLELIEDVDHRWNSLFALLERALLLRDSINYMMSTIEDMKSLPAIDWNTIQDVILFLKPFNEATKALCKASDTTISMVSAITPRLINHCSAYESNENEFISSAAKAIKAKLTSYELELYSPVVDIAYFLDPRYKTKDMSEDHWKIVHDRLRKLLDEMPTPVDETFSSENSILGCDSDSDDPLDELTAYREARRAKMKCNVLNWWRTNSEVYPKLYEVARKILPIQATSVASERVFSVAGDVHNKSRNRLSDESVANIVLFKSWMNYLNKE